MSQRIDEIISRPSRIGKSTLVTNAFLAEAKAGKSVRFESLDYVCMSRKALESFATEIRESERERIRKSLEGKERLVEFDDEDRENETLSNAYRLTDLVPLLYPEVLSQPQTKEGER